MRKWLLKPDPLGEPRNSLAVYLLVLAFASGVVTLAGFTASASVNRTLTEWSELVWAGMLVGGPGAALAGMYWQGDQRTGLGLKKIGFFTTGIASSIYAFIVVFSGWPGATFNGGIILGFGLVCFARWRKVSKRIHEIIELSTVMK